MEKKDPPFKVNKALMFSEYSLRLILGLLGFWMFIKIMATILPMP